MEDSLKKRYILKLLSNAVSSLLGVVMLAIVPKALGPVAYGQFSYLQRFFNEIVGFLDAGSSTAFFTKLSAIQDRKELISFYMLFSFVLLGLLFAFVYAVEVFGFTHQLLPDIPVDMVYFGLVFGFLTWLTQIFIRISDAYALTVSTEVIKMLHKIASLLLLLYFIYFLVFDLKSYFYFHFISLLSFLALTWYLFAKRNIFSGELVTLKIDFKAILKEFVDFCSPLVIYSTVGLAVGVFDVWLLQKVAGSEQTGFYGFAYGIVAASFLFTSAMTPIITREFSRSYADRDVQNMGRLFARYIPMLYSTAAYFGIFLAFESGSILQIFTDARFKDAYWVVVIMSFYPLHQTYGQLSGSIFYATEQTELYKNIGIVSMLAGVLLSLVFIWLFDFGAMGLAIKMILTQIFGVTIQLYFNAKFLDLKIKDFIWHQIYSVALFSMAAFVATLPFHFSSALLNLTLSGLLYTIFVIITAYIFPQTFAVTKVEIRTNLQRLYGVFKK